MSRDVIPTYFITYLSTHKIKHFNSSKLNFIIRLKFHKTKKQIGQQAYPIHICWLNTNKLNLASIKSIEYHKTIL